MTTDFSPETVELAVEGDREFSEVINVDNLDAYEYLS